MRQILLNNQGALVARMPRPTVGGGEVLVRVRYSLISTGTELASLRPSTGTSEGDAPSAPRVAVTYLGKAKDPWGNEKIGFETETAINRKDYGLAWNQVLEAGGVLVGERIDIEIEVEAVKQTAAKAA